MTPQSESRLQELEAVIYGDAKWITGAMAYGEIRDGELFRPEYGSWDVYLAERWGDETNVIDPLIEVAEAITATRAGETEPDPIRLDHKAVVEGCLERAPAAQTILEIGAATGGLLALLGSRFPQASLVGAESNEGLLWLLRARFDGDPRVNVVQSPAEALPLESEHFDLVVACQSFHHWLDPGAVIAEIGRVLAPGGVLLMADTKFGRLRRQVDLMVAHAGLCGVVWRRLRMKPMPMLTVLVAAKPAS